MLLASLNLAVSINNKNINERIIVIFISLTLMATRTEMREPFMDLHEQSTALNLSLASLVHTHTDRTECSSWFCEDLASVCKCKKKPSLVHLFMNALRFLAMPFACSCI